MAEEAHLKNRSEIDRMTEGGRKLAEIKKEAVSRIKPGVSAWEIEELVTDLIIQAGGKPSFKMVPNYSWSTCINLDHGLVHGIPKKKIVFQDGDLVSLDLGMFFKGLHTDTATTILVGQDPKKEQFLEVGRLALKRAIKQTRAGRKMKDVSGAIEQTIKEAGCQPIRALSGHGVGHELHEFPPVPCFLSGQPIEEFKLEPGLVIAIEVMYAQGNPEVVVEDDGWTIGTKDAKISALFEESVAVLQEGNRVLTA